ncbi:hypothetical protein ACSLO7_30550, partial [Klebsiella pneumoniae]
GRCRRGEKRALFSPPPEDGLHRVHDSRIRRYSQARRPPPVRAGHRIVSNASCTTNCIIPIIKLLDDAYGIESGTVTTIHSA